MFKTNNLKTFKRFFYTILFAGLTVIACKKDYSDNHNSSPTPMNLNDSAHSDDHGDSTFPDSATNIVVSTAPIYSSCVLNQGGILRFTNSQCFNDLIQDLTRSDLSVVDNWENNLSFKSRRRFWDSTFENSDNIDDLEAFDSVRLTDSYFESVLNRNDEIIIGDTLYDFNFDSGIVLVKHLPTNISWTITGTYKFKKSNGNCGNYSIQRGDKNYGNGEFMNATKFIDWYGVYSSVGIRQDYYKYNFRNKAKKRRTDKLTMFIDQWAFLDWTTQGSMFWNVVTNVKRSVSNKNDQVWLFATFGGIGVPQICVRKFGRVHCYKDDFFNDLHHDDW